MTKLYLFNLKNFDLEKYDYSILPSNVVHHCGKYKDKKINLLSRFTWVSLCSILVKEYGVCLNDELFVFDEDKPRIQNDKLFFSLSHTDGAVTILISDSECGVDIQRSFSSTRIAERILSNSEYKYFKKCLNKTTYLNKKWVAKEAMIKQHSQGIFSPMMKKTTSIKQVKTVMFAGVQYYYCCFCDDKNYDIFFY